ncbi:chaperone modulator CbpM [Roseisalinus antarcticus]|uniref:Chaperone modulatory protein CbpM n=1 Tax=Roseisalinus antarcticus TaxID=254357 RepID=A0A1Y5SCE2_9RHOB|nr:chaperone modulator CbpM [Roseisalinus antarcticus]SLN37423.1 hypothetical protein ROA7023_01402 [Roseisalinus antarcticus]
MSEYMTEEDVLTVVTRLSRPRLARFLEDDLVRPDRTSRGPVFRQIDVARLTLLCELSDDLEIDETVLGVIVALLDELHGVRQDLRTIARAIEAQPPDLRARIGALLREPGA